MPQEAHKKGAVQETTVVQNNGVRRRRYDPEPTPYFDSLLKQFEDVYFDIVGEHNSAVQDFNTTQARMERAFGIPAGHLFDVELDRSNEARFVYLISEGQYAELANVLEALAMAEAGLRKDIDHFIQRREQVRSDMVRDGATLTRDNIMESESFDLRDHYRMKSPLSFLGSNRHNKKRAQVSQMQQTKLFLELCRRTREAHAVTLKPVQRAATLDIGQLKRPLKRARSTLGVLRMADFMPLMTTEEIQQAIQA